MNLDLFNHISIERAECGSWALAKLLYFLSHDAFLQTYALSQCTFQKTHISDFSRYFSTLLWIWLATVDRSPPTSLVRVLVFLKQIFCLKR